MRWRHEVLSIYNVNTGADNGIRFNAYPHEEFSGATLFGGWFSDKRPSNEAWCQVIRP